MTKVSFYLAVWPDETANIIATDNKDGFDLWSCLDEIANPEEADIYLMECVDPFLCNPMSINLIPVDPVGPWHKPKRKRKKKNEVR